MDVTVDDTAIHQSAELLNLNYITESSLYRHAPKKIVGVSKLHVYIDSLYISYGLLSHGLHSNVTNVYIILIKNTCYL